MEIPAFRSRLPIGEILDALRPIGQIAEDLEPQMFAGRHGIYLVGGGKSKSPKGHVVSTAQSKHYFKIFVEPRSERNALAIINHRIMVERKVSGRQLTGILLYIVAIRRRSEAVGGEINGEKIHVEQMSCIDSQYAFAQFHQFLELGHFWFITKEPSSHLFIVFETIYGSFGSLGQFRA